MLDYLGSSQLSDVCDGHIALVVQVSKLEAKSTSAAFINCEQDGSIKQVVVDGKTKCVYISLESLSIPK